MEMLLCKTPMEKRLCKAPKGSARGLGIPYREWALQRPLGFMKLLYIRSFAEPLGASENPYGKEASDTHTYAHFSLSSYRYRGASQSPFRDGTLQST